VAWFLNTVGVSCSSLGDGEFAFHHKLADTVGALTYFCDPYSSFQRGTNEHFNGRIRRYLPKGTSFDDVSQEELGEYVKEINNRPRKVLGWLTPAEVFHELCSKGTIT
jgi:IS30 family transposase